MVPCSRYVAVMTEDRSAAEWAARVLLALAGIMAGLYIVTTLEGWIPLVGGLAFAAGCAVWAVLPRPVAAIRGE